MDIFTSVTDIRDRNPKTLIYIFAPARSPLTLACARGPTRRRREWRWRARRSGCSSGKARPSAGARGSRTG
eukprot:206882-Prorocentrum_minimum.AAC.1